MGNLLPVVPGASALAVIIAPNQSRTVVQRTGLGAQGRRLAVPGVRREESVAHGGKETKDMREAKLFRDVNIEWVSFDDDIVHVSTFAGLRPQDRPPVFCHECMEPVVLKLGNILSHHAAHTASDCRLSLLGGGSKESVRHFNCKMHIYNQLKTGEIFNGEYKCRICQKVDYGELCRDWTDVRAENRLGNGYIPDITIERDGNAVMGIEILVSHAVDAQKAKALSEQNLDWIEVVESKALSTDWRLSRPIPLRYHSRKHDMRCQKCVQNPIVYQSPVAYQADDINRKGRIFPDRSCVLCGAKEITYASSSGPLCVKCYPQRGVADSFGLGWRGWVPTRDAAIQATDRSRQ